MAWRVDFRRYVAETEVYDEVTGWAPGPPMEVARFYASQSTLIGGRVLVCGGLVSDGASGKCTATAEMYDPKANRWVDAPSMMIPRQGCSQSTLNIGVVIVCGGFDETSALSSVELYNPKTNAWTPGPSMRVARFFASQTTLPDGRVLVAGGHDGRRPLSSVEIFDPQTRKWSDGACLLQKRHSHSMSTLTDGRALICGGETVKDQLLSTTEVYDPALDAWTPATPLGFARRGCSQSTLTEGAVLCACGHAADGAVNTVEILSKLDFAPLIPGAKILPAPPAMHAVPTQAQGAAMRGWLDAADVVVAKTQRRIEVAKQMINEHRDTVVADARKKFDAAVLELDRQLEKDIAAANEERDRRLDLTGTSVVDAIAAEVAHVRRQTDDPRKAFSNLVHLNTPIPPPRRNSTPTRTSAGSRRGFGSFDSQASDGGAAAGPGVSPSPTDFSPRPRRRTRPDNHYCAITSQVLCDPVQLSCGDTFERVGLEEWFKVHDSCPTCGKILSDKSWTPNAAAKGMVNEWIPE